MLKISVFIISTIFLLNCQDTQASIRFGIFDSITTIANKTIDFVTNVVDETVHGVTNIIQGGKESIQNFFKKKHQEIAENGQYNFDTVLSQTFQHVKAAEKKANEGYDLSECQKIIDLSNITLRDLISVVTTCLKDDHNRSNYHIHNSLHNSAELLTNYTEVMHKLTECTSTHWECLKSAMAETISYGESIIPKMFEGVFGLFGNLINSTDVTLTCIVNGTYLRISEEYIETMNQFGNCVDNFAIGGGKTWVNLESGDENTL